MNEHGLKICPFCGGVNAEADDLSKGYRWLNHPVWRAGCPNCGVWTEGESEDEVRETWNRRFPLESVPVSKAVRPILISEEDMHIKYFKCPACGEKFIDVLKETNFCSHCGQAFTWEGMDTT